MNAQPDASARSDVAIGRFYDGRVAAGSNVRLSLVMGVLTIVAEDGEVLDRWPINMLAALPRNDTGISRIHLEGGDAAVMCDDKKFLESLHRQISGRRSTGIHSGALKVACWIAGAVAAVALFFFVGLPYFADRAARALPDAWERELGQRTSAQVASLLAGSDQPFCESPAGSAALTTMMNRLGAASPSRIPLRVRVVDSPVENAFALPGGEILILRGLLNFMEHPNELAAVLAHESAHVDLRHPTENAIKRGAGAFAVGLLFGDVFGTSTIVILGQLLVSAGYSRDAEAAADAQMIVTLRNAGLASAPAAAFFDRVLTEDGDASGLFALLQSHPPSADRAANLLAAVPAGGDALNIEDWGALRSICGARTDKP